MATELRFCEECGRPLTPGVKFCEECGSPVAVKDNTVPDIGATAMATGQGTFPLAVVPLAYQHHGVFSIDRCTLVVYPDQVIIASVPESMEDENDQAMNEVQAALAEKHLEGKKFWQLASGAGSALFRLAWSPVDFYTADAIQEQKLLGNITIRTRPWERYLSMGPGAVLSEDSRNRAVPRDSVSYIRGESDPSTGTDQVLISSPDGLIRLFFDYGTYSLARSVLMTFLLKGPVTGEKVLGVIPSASEPQVKGFGFQYTWTVVVTGMRVIFCMIEDDFADEMNEWIGARRKDAKKAGRKWREGELAGLPDAPWQRFMAEPMSSLLGNDVNFFIPLSAIQSVQLVPGGPGKADKLSILLPGEPFSVVFPEGTACHIREVLEKALPGRVS